MPQDLYSIEQVAGLLGLHVKTVRAYVRDGRLKAVRIGKQYRIARADLEALTGRPVAALEGPGVRRTRHIEVSSVVDIDAIDPDLAGRITNFVTAAMKGRPKDDAPARIEAIYDETRARLKLVILGGIETTRTLLAAVRTMTEG